MTKKYFITGIGTDVGKTVIAAIVVEALKADYWKPIQCGDLENSDTHTVKSYISNKKSVFHPNTYALKTPMSPHAAADIEGIKIDCSQIICPKTDNFLVIEGAGGLLVPINDTQTILDIIDDNMEVIIVSKNYLGSINHTLLTIEILKQSGKKIKGIIFNGNRVPTTENIILKKTNLTLLGRVQDHKVISPSLIQKYAHSLESKLK